MGLRRTQPFQQDARTGIAAAIEPVTEARNPLAAAQSSLEHGARALGVRDLVEEGFDLPTDAAVEGVAAAEATQRTVNVLTLSS